MHEEHSNNHPYDHGKNVALSLTMIMAKMSLCRSSKLLVSKPYTIALSDNLLYYSWWSIKKIKVFECYSFSL